MAGMAASASLPRARGVGLSAVSGENPPAFASQSCRVAYFPNHHQQQQPQQQQQEEAAQFGAGFCLVSKGVAASARTGLKPGRQLPALPPHIQSQSLAQVDAMRASPPMYQLQQQLAEEKNLTPPTMFFKFGGSCTRLFILLFLVVDWPSLGCLKQ